MAGINKVILIGHLGKDPEIRTTERGSKVATFSLATSEAWKDKNSGERKEATEWHNVVVFNEGLIGLAENYLKKGAKIYIEGALKTRKWQDKTGNDRWSTEIVLANFRGEIQMLDKSDSRPAPEPEQYGTVKDARPNMGEAIDDEIPF